MGCHVGCLMGCPIGGAIPPLGSQNIEDTDRDSAISKKERGLGSLYRAAAMDLDRVYGCTLMRSDALCVCISRYPMILPRVCTDLLTCICLH